MVALAALTPIQAHAFGLGSLKLSSALNEPFKAEIPVTELREDERGNLQVRLATSSEFNKAGLLDRNFFLTHFAFKVVEKTNSTVIEVSSVQPVKEPFIDFMISATTGKGRLLREYIVLLDPAKTVIVKPKKAVTPTKKSSSSTTNNKTAYQYPANSREPSSLVNDFSGNSYGPTKRHDTLWMIAQETRAAAVSVHQMMIAILDANPNAFINNNINTIKTGQTLTIPSIDEVSRLPHSQAVARAKEQTAQWKAAANTKIATAQQTTDAMPAVSDGVQSSPNMTENEDTARLQLVVTDDTAAENDGLAASGSDTLTNLKDQLTLAQETIEGQDQEIIDFKSRMDTMEEQLTIMRNIVLDKDSDLASLQDMLRKDQQIEMASDELSEEMQSTFEQSDEAEEVDTTMDEMMVVPYMAVAEAAETVEVMDDTKIIRIGLFEKVKVFIADNKIKILYGLAGLFVVLLGWFFIRRRNQSDYEWDENDSLQNIDASDAELVEGDNVEKNMDPTHIDPVDEEVETAAEQEAILPVDLTNEITEESIDNLLNQAEMSIAYGEYEQAHLLVEKARQQEPANQDVALKLIALAYHQQQAEEFSKLAGEIDIDKDSAAWLEVVEWGKDLVPDNPLFADSASASEQVSSGLDSTSSEDEITLETTLEDDNDEITLETTLEDDNNEIILETTLEDDNNEITLETTLEDDNNEITLEATLEDDNNEITLETTLEDDNNEIILEATLEDDNDEITLETTLEDDNNEIILETTLEDDNNEITLETTLEDNEDPAEELDTGEDYLDFDIGDVGEVDEAETKLDLAASYADMGDLDGARNILNEVLKEGNDEQKSRAQDSLNNLK